MAGEVRLAVLGQQRLRVGDMVTVKLSVRWDGIKPSRSSEPMARS